MEQRIDKINAIRTKAANLEPTTSARRSAKITGRGKFASSGDSFSQRTEPPTVATYTFKLNNGNTYILNQDQVDWVKNRYKQTAAGNYGDDVEDAIRASVGKLPVSFEASYRNTTLDKQLFEQGLPSEKYIEEYIGSYVNWYGDGQTYQFDKQAQSDISKKFKASWEYEYTFEDQARKRQGLAPTKIAAKYGDNLRDSTLMEQGLPPEVMLSDYVAEWETTQYETTKKNQLYFAATAAMMDAEKALGGYQKLDDAARLKIFNDVYVSKDYDDIRHLFQKSPEQPMASETPDELSEYDTIWAAMSKEQKTSDELLISYADFINGYGTRKQDLLINNAAYNAQILEDQNIVTKGVLNRNDAEEYAKLRKEEDPAVVFKDMYDNGVKFTQINNAHKWLKEAYSTDEKKQAEIEAAYQAIKSQYSADRAANKKKFDWVEAATPDAQGYLEDSANGTFSFLNFINPEAREGYAQNREDNSSFNVAVATKYENGELSTVNADDGEAIFRSHLIYDDKGRPTGESVKAATNALYDAGATTNIVKEIGKRVGISYGGLKLFSPAARAFQYNVDKRDLEQRKQLVEATRKTMVGSGAMTDFEFDQTVSRKGWSDALDMASRAEHYYTEYEKPQFEANGESVPAWGELPQEYRDAYVQNFEETETYNPEIHKSAKEIVTSRLVQAFIGGLIDLDAGLIANVDKAFNRFQGRTEMWDVTKHFLDVQRKITGSNVSNQSGAAQAGNLAATVAQQFERMAALQAVGSGIASMAFGASGEIALIANATTKTTKGLNLLSKAGTFFVQSSPFIANAMGQYYAEAMQSGASPSQAVLYGDVCGFMEGALEGIGTELWLGRLFGSKLVARGIINSGMDVLKAGSISATSVFINLAASALGNAGEEWASYAISTAMKQATYDKDAEYDPTEARNQAGMGALIGLLGAGLNAGSETNAGITASFFSTESGMKWATSERGSPATIDLLAAAVIADQQSPNAAAMLSDPDNVRSISEYVAIINDIEASSRQIEETQKKYDTDIEKINTELQVKQDAVDAAWAIAHNGTGDGSPESVTAWKKAVADLRVAEKELAVEKAQHDAKIQERTSAFKESTAQQNIALEKAQQKVAAHSVALAAAFRPEILQMAQAVRDGVDIDMVTLGQQVLAKMDAARAGKLKEFVKAQLEQQAQVEARQNQTAGEAQSVQAPTIQPTSENASTGVESPVIVENAAQEPQSNIKSEATPANPAETFGIVDPRLQETMNGLKQFGRNFYKRVVSGASGTERASRVQKKLGVGGVSIDASAQGIRNSNGTAQFVLGDALVDINGKPIGDSFIALFNDIPAEKWGDFQTYILAKHTEARMTLEEREYGNNKPVLASESGVLDPDGNPIAMDANEAAALAARLESANPDFSRIHDNYRTWWKNFMRSWAVDGGLMTETQFNALDAKYPDYVPTYRVDKNSVGGSSRVTRNSVSIPSAIKNATGSTDEIQDIRLSLADMVKRYVVMERRNELVQNLYNFAESHTQAAAEFAKIYEEESNWSPDVDFVSFDELANQSAAEVKDGQYIIRGFRDGERIAMFVNQDVYDAFNYLMNPSDVSVRSKHENEILKGARAITKPIKGAITGYNPFFAVMNLFRDAQTYFVNTESAFIDTFGNIGRAVKERAANSELWQSYLALGGGSSGFITSQLVTDAKVTGKGKVAAVAQKAGEAVSWLGGYTENMFRFAEYINGVAKHGNTAEGRRMAIAAAADVTVNFSRSGAYTKAADSFCLYLNANVQGLDKMARTIAKNPKKTLLRGLTLAGIGLLVRYLTGNDDNPHYENLTNYVKDTYYCIPNVLGERDDNGYCTTFIKIPKSREYGTLIVATAERAARLVDGEEDAFDDLGTDIWNSVGVGIEPFWQAAQAITTNKNYYGGDIVPAYMKNSEVAPDQTNAQTSVVSDAISERLYDLSNGKIKVSPMVLDYIINQYGGFYGQFLTSATAKDSAGIGRTAANIVSDKFVADPLYSSGVVGKFYDAIDEAQDLARDSEREREQFGISLKSKDELAYETFDDYTKQIAKLRKQERELLASEKDTPARKAQIDAIREEINRVAAEGIAAWNGR